jgi:hypothetical protein
VTASAENWRAFAGLMVAEQRKPVILAGKLLANKIKQL